MLNIKLKYFDYFDMVYLINLPNRQDKYIKSIELFNILNISNYKIIKPIEYLDDIKILSKSSESCKLSHIRCLQDAIDNNFDRICIFEDDICFNQENSSVINNLDSHLEICFNFLSNNNWDIFYFDNMLSVKKNNNKLTAIGRYGAGQLVIPILGKKFAHSYGVSKSSFIKIINEHKSNNLRNDVNLFNIRLNKFMYLDGIFDQSLNMHSDNDWTEINTKI